MAESTSRAAPAPLLIAAAIGLAGGIGCIPKLEHRAEVARVHDLPPITRQEPGPPTDVVIVEPVGGTGALDVRYETRRACVATVIERTQTIERRTYRAENLPGAFVSGLLSTAAGVGLTVAAVRAESDADILWRFALPLDIFGVAALGFGFYFLARDGSVDEVPAQISYKPARQRAIAPGDERVCEREPVAGVALDLLVEEQGGPPAVFSLGTTDRDGALRFDLLHALSARYPGWPKSPVELSPSASLTLAGDRAALLRLVDLSKYPALRLRENSDYARATKGSDAGSGAPAE